MRIRISLILTHEFFGRRRARLDDRDNEVSGSARAEQAAFVDTVLPMLAELAGQDRRPRSESIDVLIPSGAPRMARRDGKEVRVRHVVGATACNLP